jgi:Cu(I)/Ag(I) efflux system membrane fusion protein
MNISFKNIIPQEKNTRILWGVTIILAFLMGWMLSVGDSEKTPQHGTIEKMNENTVWTCSMHPQIQQPKPGKCPICGMDLIPINRGTDRDDNPRHLSLSKTAKKLAELETAPVERKFVSQKIRMVGKIKYDETRLRYITAWVAGRIDKLYVNYTGISVRKGDHLVELYSPDLLSTQQELIESTRTIELMREGGFPTMQETAKRQLQSVRERLRLWGLTEKQIKAIETEKKPSDHMTIYSPMSGVVVHKDALEGKYVNTGTRIYTIADLSRVWALIEAYESDLQWLRYGQQVEFTTESYPGESFKGVIAFIDPLLDPKTRTVKIRVNVENQGGKLKPEMFVRAIVSSSLVAAGKVIDPDLAGKWISPMHPEIVKDRPGKCDICGMPLVKAENLGYVSAEGTNERPPLVIPASAPLITGKRAVVYVEVPGREGTYEGRDIELGPRAGNYYLVKSGLKEGERVVTKGNFKIDSAIQIQAGPSMMNPEGGGPVPGHQHDQDGQQKKKPQQNEQLEIDDPMKKTSSLPMEFIQQLDKVYQYYFVIQQAFSHDNLETAIKDADKILQTTKEVDMSSLPAEANNLWMQEQKVITTALEDIEQTAKIENARHSFQKLSESLISLARSFGSQKHQLLVFHCPMAFDSKGANWLQGEEGVENPYFGSSMFECGSVTENLTVTDKHQGHQHE